MYFCICVVYLFYMFCMFLFFIFVSVVVSPSWGRFCLFFVGFEWLVGAAPSAPLWLWVPRGADFVHLVFAGFGLLVEAAPSAPIGGQM